MAVFTRLRRYIQPFKRFRIVFLTLLVIAIVKVIYSKYAAGQGDPIPVVVKTSDSLIPTPPSDLDKKRVPDAIIVGVSRCGTTPIVMYLGLHPKARVISGEINFFSDEKRLSQGYESYVNRLLPAQPDGTVVVERSTEYWKTGVADKVKAFYEAIGKPVKIIVVVCEPTQRVQSWYLTGRYRAFQTGTNEEKMAYPEFEPTIYDFDKEELRRSYTGIRTAEYDTFIPTWLRHFRRNQIHFVDGEKLKDDPFQEMRKIEKFLGLSHGIDEKRVVFDEDKHFFCVRKPDGTKFCLDHTKGRDHPPVSEVVMKKLKSYYKDHNRKFSQLTDQHFSWMQ